MSQKIQKLVDRFLAWPLPSKVASDHCVTESGYPNRTGTNLLTADEAESMFEHVVGPTLDQLDVANNRFDEIWKVLEECESHRGALFLHNVRLNKALERAKNVIIYGKHLAIANSDTGAKKDFLKALADIDAIIEEFNFDCFAHGSSEKVRKELLTLRAENARLREALEFYAGSPGCVECGQRGDQGDRATEALYQSDKEKVE